MVTTDSNRWGIDVAKAGNAAKTTTGVPQANTWGTTPTRAKIQWVLDHPDFRFKPATIEEFLGPGYLDIDIDQNASLDPRSKVRPGLKKALIEIFGSDIDPLRISLMRRALFTGGIGIGKTTLASIALSYMVHWVSCLAEPQKYFGLLPGSRIAFMLMSTKGSQTNEVLFADIKARVAASPWFQKHALPNADNKTRQNQLRFPRDIWIIPGNSQETTFEGYNVLAGILDEGDSHKVTETKDYAEAGWDTIENRISSRFTDLITGDHLGLIIAIGQMKMADGFMARKKKELEDDIEQALRAGKLPTSHVNVMTIWESHGWESYRDPKTGKIPVFYFDKNRRVIVPAGPGSMYADTAGSHVMRIPDAYKKLFTSDPVKALKDQAGIPPAVEDPFIQMTDRVDAAFDRYERHHPDLKVPVGSNPHNPLFADNLICVTPQKRVIHVDIGYSNQGDAGALAMGYIKEVVDVDGEWKPYIVFDMLMRIMPRGGEDLMLKVFRDKVVTLRDERKFPIKLVSYDGFQSQDSLQILRKQFRFNTGEVSVDRSKGPYEDLREAINEQRIEFPRYMTLLRKDSTDKTCVVRKELLELKDMGRKIDHPPRGSKDIADAIAGVVGTLMGNDAYRRGVKKGHLGKSKPDEDLTPLDLSDYSAPQTLSLTPVDLNFRQDGDELLEHFLAASSAGKRGPMGLPAIEADPFGLINSRPRMR